MISILLRVRYRRSRSRDIVTDPSSISPNNAVHSDLLLLCRMAALSSYSSYKSADLIGIVFLYPKCIYILL